MGVVIPRVSFGDVWGRFGRNWVLVPEASALWYRRQTRSGIGAAHVRLRTCGWTVRRQVVCVWMRMFVLADRPHSLIEAVVGGRLREVYGKEKQGM